MNHPAASKINYTAIFISLINIAATKGLIPEDIRPEIVNIVNTAGPAMILVFRTWFTDKRQ